VKFIETTNHFHNDVLVSIQHKDRPWYGVSYSMARPALGHTGGRTNVGYLAAAFMRICDNCQHYHDAVIHIAKMGREAIKGARFSKTMVRQAARAVWRHPKYTQGLRDLHGLYMMAMKGMG
jgi:hypothetical protein